MFLAEPTSKIESSGLLTGTSRGKRIASRAVLMSGFSALLVLMAIQAIDSIRALRALEASTSQMRHEYLARERTLHKIRVSIYESGNLLHEYALTRSSPKTRESYVAHLSDMRDHAHAAVEACLRESQSSFQDPVRKLAGELENYWLAANHTLSQGTGERDQALLRRAAIDQRAAVLAMAGEVSRVNELELRLAELEISNVFAKSRSRLQNFSALAIGIGLILATACIIYVSRLENRAEERHQENLRYQDELKELTKRVVDDEEHERRAISRVLQDEITRTLGALLIHVQDLLDDPQAIGPSRGRLEKIRLLAEEAKRKVRNTELLLRSYGFRQG